LVGWLVVWLVGWLVGCLVGWLVVWLAGWLVDLLRQDMLCRPSCPLILQTPASTSQVLCFYF
jgi:hypothetical protein